jgi:hypothetical protein
MDSPLIYEGTIDAATVVPNMPLGRVAYLQTSGAAVDIEWWDGKAEVWSASQTIDEPGDEVSCPSNKCRLAPAASTSIRIFIGR